MPIGTCDPASRGDAYNSGELAIDNGNVTIEYRYGWDGPRTATNVQLTNGSPTVTRAAGGIKATDVDRTVTGTGIPANTTIVSVTSSTQAVMSANATATRTSTVTVGGSTRTSDWGCIGPFVEGTGAGNAWALRAENDSAITYYAHFTGKRGNPRTITMPPGFLQTYTVAQLASAGFDDNTDLDDLSITTTP